MNIKPAVWYGLFTGGMNGEDRRIRPRRGSGHRRHSSWPKHGLAPAVLDLRREKRRRTCLGANSWLGEWKLTNIGSSPAIQPAAEFSVDKKTVSA